ncbi:MAG TPA: DUF3737 family protein [Bacilli bacterium]|nr:DUF3737 family protein [Bacilli bacterium]
MKIKYISHETSDVERAYFGSKNTFFESIEISGPVDGESAFKESQNLKIINSKFSLRYPCWHNQNLHVFNSKITKTARAPFWYGKNITLDKVKIYSPKAVREVIGVDITNSLMKSDEFGWKCRRISTKNSTILGFYAFFDSKMVHLEDSLLEGKYSFQYIDGLTIDRCILKTKDAFWHTKNAVVRNSTIIGEYLGWHCENIVFENCTIVGTQPLCYAKNIVLNNCKFTDSDLAFEYSEINGNILNSSISIKNPLSGKLIVDKMPELIIDENDRSEGRFSLEKNK